MLVLNQLSPDPSFRNTETSLANLIGSATFAPVNVVAHGFRCDTHLGIAVQAPGLPAGLIETTAEQSGRSEATLRFGQTEVVGGTDPIDTLLGAVGAAAGTVDVVAQCGAEFAGIRFRDFIDALILTAFLIGGATKKAR